jgi:hypothetical protein
VLLAGHPNLLRLSEVWETQATDADFVCKNIFVNLYFEYQLDNIHMDPKVTIGEGGRGMVSAQDRAE